MIARCWPTSRSTTPGLSPSWWRSPATPSNDEPIRSLQNRKVVDATRFHRLKERVASGLTLLEGPHLLAETIRSGMEPVRVFVMEGDIPPETSGEIVVVDEKVMKRLAGTETPRGPIAVVPIPTHHRPLGWTALVAWGISDPGNLGTLVRTAAAFGYPMVIGPGTTDPWSPKVLRAGAGGHFHTTVTSVGRLDELDDLRLLATVVAGGSAPEDLDDGPWAIMIGSEPHGLPDEVVAASTTVTIPMVPGTESLNAAVAGAIIAYALTHPSGIRD